MQRAFASLDTANNTKKGGAVSNFHGIHETAKAMDINEKELREAYRAHRAQLKANLKAPKIVPVPASVNSPREVFKRHVSSVADGSTKNSSEGHRNLIAELGSDTAKTFSYSSFHKTVTRVKGSTEPIKSDDIYFPLIGRGDRIPAELIQALKSNSAKSKDMAGSSSEKVASGARNMIKLPGFNPNVIQGTFQNELKETQKMIFPQKAPRVYSESSVRKLIMLSRDENKSDTKSGQQNARRQQAMLDPYNFLALVIMLMVVNKETTVDRRLIFNTDKSSHCLNDDVKTIILTAFGAKEELEEHHRNPTTTKKGTEAKRRGIAYTPITNSEGELIAFTTHIKDTTFNTDGRVNTYKLKVGEYLQTIPVSTVSKRYAAQTTATPPLPQQQPATKNTGAEPETGEDSCSDDDDDVETLTYAEQEAEQYIELVVLPAIREYRDRVILEDLHTQAPPVAIGRSTAQTTHTGREDELITLRESPRYRILMTMDGEREHVKAVNKVMGSDAARLAEFVDAGINGTPVDRAEWASRVKALNLEFLKLSASCSKTQQSSDVAKGFNILHEFFKGAQFRLFDPKQMNEPAVLQLVLTILKDVPAASKASFSRYFYAKDYAIAVALSKKNGRQGFVLTGMCHDDSTVGPNYRKILSNCPTIVDRSKVNEPVDDYYNTLLQKCTVIAEELVDSKVADRSYLGTPDDQRMFTSFGNDFGDIHIGTSEVSSGNRVTELDFIRWRATVFGSIGQRILAARKNARKADVIDDNVTNPEGNKRVTGKFCGNYTCPLGSRYSLAQAAMWKKCKPSCIKCHGRVHVCSDPACITFYNSIHMQ